MKNPVKTRLAVEIAEENIEAARQLKREVYNQDLSVYDPYSEDQRELDRMIRSYGHKQYRAEQDLKSCILRGGALTEEFWENKVGFRASNEKWSKSWGDFPMQGFRLVKNGKKK
jgi:hypothetical protein